MKKGFTMIELIFVIVILGILASVAIPRLAATREDAEISAAVANIRTLISDVSAYYTAKDEFPTDMKWNAITNVPLDNANQAATNTANLKVGGKNCIGVQLATGTTPHIVFTKESTNANSGVCKQVVEAAPVKAYLESKITGDNTAGKMAIGSSTSIYQSTTN